MLLFIFRVSATGTLGPRFSNVFPCTPDIRHAISMVFWLGCAFKKKIIFLIVCVCEPFLVFFEFVTILLLLFVF